MMIFTLLLFVKKKNLTCARFQANANDIILVAYSRGLRRPPTTPVNKLGPERRGKTIPLNDSTIVIPTKKLRESKPCATGCRRWVSFQIGRPPHLNAQQWQIVVPTLAALAPGLVLVLVPVLVLVLARA
jgi:hypothetical protein